LRFWIREYYLSPRAGYCGFYYLHGLAELITMDRFYGFRESFMGLVFGLVSASTRIFLRARRGSNIVLAVRMCTARPEIRMSDSRLWFRNRKKELPTKLFSSHGHIGLLTPNSSA
jgi:hypothetical protein